MSRKKDYYKKLTCIREILINLDQHQIELKNIEKVYENLLNESKDTLNFLAYEIKEEDIEQFYPFYFQLEGITYKAELIPFLCPLGENKALDIEVISKFLSFYPNKYQTLNFISTIKRIEKANSLFMEINSFFEQGKGGFSSLSKQQFFSLYHPFCLDRKTLNPTSENIEKVYQFLLSIQEDNPLLKKQYLTQKEMINFLSNSFCAPDIIDILSSKSILSLLEQGKLTHHEYLSILWLARKNSSKDPNRSLEAKIFTNPNLERIICSGSLSIGEVIDFVKKTDNRELQPQVILTLLNEDWTKYCLENNIHIIKLSQQITSIFPSDQKEAISYLYQLQKHSRVLIERIKQNSLTTELSNFKQLIDYLNSCPKNDEQKLTSSLANSPIMDYFTWQEILEILKQIAFTSSSEDFVDFIFQLSLNDNFNELGDNDLTKYEIIPYLIEKLTIEPTDNLMKQKLITIRNIVTSTNFKRQFYSSFSLEITKQLVDIILTCHSTGQLQNIEIVSQEHNTSMTLDNYLTLLFYMKDLEIKRDSNYYLYGEYIRYLDKILLEEGSGMSIVIPAVTRVRESEEVITVKSIYSTELEESELKIKSHKKYSILQKVSKHW